MASARPTSGASSIDRTAGSDRRARPSRRNARAWCSRTWSRRAGARPGAPRRRSRSPSSPPPSCGSARCRGRPADRGPRRRARRARRARRCRGRRRRAARRWGCRTRARRSGARRARLVSRISLREVSGFPLGRMPTRASSGAVSSKIRPLDSAMLISPWQQRARFYRRNRADSYFIRSTLGAERAELLLERLVAAIEVVDAVDHRLALGHQAGDDQAGRGAQVGRHDGRALQPLDAAHDGGIALDRDVGAEALQLERVHEAILEDGLGDRRAVPSRDAASAMNCACMSVAKPGIRRGAHAHRRAAARPHFDVDPGVARGDRARRPRAASRAWRRGSRARRRLSRTSAAGRRGGARDRCRSRCGRASRVGGAAERAHAFDADDVGAGALDPRAHRDEAFARGRPPRARARRSRAASSPSASVAAIIRFSVPVTVTMSMTMRAPRRPLRIEGLGVHVAVLDADRRAHRLQALHVLVDRPRPMAQPPGSDTLARPQRASSGPSTSTEARIVFTSS